MNGGTSHKTMGNSPWFFVVVSGVPRAPLRVPAPYGNACHGRN